MGTITPPLSETCLANSGESSWQSCLDTDTHCKASNTDTRLQVGSCVLARGSSRPTASSGSSLEGEADATGHLAPGWLPSSPSDLSLSGSLLRGKADTLSLAAAGWLPSSPSHPSLCESLLQGKADTIVLRVSGWLPSSTQGCRSSGTQMPHQLQCRPGETRSFLECCASMVAASSRSTLRRHASACLRCILRSWDLLAAMQVAATMATKPQGTRTQGYKAAIASCLEPKKRTRPSYLVFIFSAPGVCSYLVCQPPTQARTHAAPKGPWVTRPEGSSPSTGGACNTRRSCSQVTGSVVQRGKDVGPMGQAQPEPCPGPGPKCKSH